MSPVERCPTTEELSQLYQKRLPAERAHEVVPHVRRCKMCLGLMQSMDAKLRASAPTKVEAERRAAKSPSSSGHGGSGSLSDLLRLVRHSTIEAEGGPTTSFASKHGDESLGTLAHYQLLQELGEGGMGMVYKAQDLNLDRRVALKVIKPDVSADLMARQRFLREARAMAALRHDHIVTIYEVGEAGDTLYISMEYLRGATLDKVFAPGSPAPLAQILRIGREVASGLAAAHAAGLIHRDIKATNLWMESPSCRIKILDFGLATVNTTEMKLTGTGHIVGTPDCMAPEQARGLTVDERCDLFSLGSILYQLLTGRKPFQGDDVLARLTSLAVDAPPSIRAVNPAVPERLEDLVMRLLAKEPDHRPSTALEVLEELAAIKRATEATPVPAPPPAPKAKALAPSAPPVASTPPAPNPHPRPLHFPQYRIAIVAGDFVIEGIANTLAVIAVDNGIVLHDLATDRKYEVTLGERDSAMSQPKLLVKDLASSMVFETATFSIKREGKDVFRARFESR